MRILEVNDEEAMCYYEGGLNATYAGEYDLAVESFKRVIAASPEHAAAHAGLCLAYHESGLSLEMCDAFERLSAIEAANGERLFGLALVYYEGGEMSAAHRNAWRAIKLTRNDALTFYVHGRLLLEVGRCDRERIFLSVPWNWLLVFGQCTHSYPGSHLTFRWVTTNGDCG
jgi:tetratricopeptide (TPR) repeat protein